MEPFEELLRVSHEEDRDRVRDLIGADRLVFLLAKLALEHCGEKLDADAAAKLLKLSKRSGRRRTQKPGDGTRQ